MASFEQAKYCPNCKKNVSATKDDRCKICGNKVERGTWSVRFRYIEKDGQEKQKRLSGFSTKKEANIGYVDFVNKSKLQTAIDPSKKILFEHLYEEYKSYTKTRIKESSYYDFCSKCNLHILPFFQTKYVNDISMKMLLDWQSTINKYSYKYKTCLRQYLNSILNYADKYYNIENKLKKVDNFRNVELKKEMLFWTPDEFSKFIQCVEPEDFKPYFYALYYTGARKGELLATTWKDWDLTKHTLNINKTVTKKVYGSTYLITVPKNQSSIRTITLPDFLVKIMEDYKKGREDYKFVFKDNKPLADSTIERIQISACKKSEVKKIRIHDFRHSHASLLLANGASVVAVAKRLGHSNIEQTLNTYAHMLPKEDEMLLNILQKSHKN